MKHTDKQLMRVHIALLGGGTIKALARQMGYDYGQLSKQLKAWRIKHDTGRTIK